VKQFSNDSALSASIYLLRRGAALIRDRAANRRHAHGVLDAATKTRRHLRHAGAAEREILPISTSLIPVDIACYNRLAEQKLVCASKCSIVSKLNWPL